MSDYQTLFGLSTISSDYIKTSNVYAESITTNAFQLNGGTSNKVLTSDSVGNATWQNIPSITLVGDASGPTNATIVNSLAGGTIPVPTVVTLGASQILTNKTLWAPKITSIVNDGISVLNVPSAADTLVARATVDTLTTKH